jgi:hypothetical protein
MKFQEASKTALTVLTHCTQRQHCQYRTRCILKVFLFGQTLSRYLLAPAPPADQANGGNYLVKPGTAVRVSLMPLAATTLTLSCHKEQASSVGPLIGLEYMIETACQGLSITPEQLRQELEAGSDLPDLASGALTPKALRLAAQILVLLRYIDVPEPAP